MNKYMNRTCSFAERLVAFATVEGILFSASFCAIYFFKKKNLMPGLTLSNQFIARDEGMHTDFAVLLHSHLQEQVSQERITEIVADAVAVETAFVKSALQQSLLGMSADSMTQYVQYVSDRLLMDFGCKKLYNVKNPFDWMGNISLQGHSSFFEVRPSDYSIAGVGTDPGEQVFSTEFVF